jgi:HEAT repeat protein
MRVGAVLFAALLLTGCNKQDPPVLSHGKPVDHWIQTLQSSVSKQRKQAVAALGHVGAADPRAIPALMTAVKDRDAIVRQEAVLALLNIGPEAKEAVAALTEATKDKDAKVRSYATKALSIVNGPR